MLLSESRLAAPGPDLRVGRLLERTRRILRAAPGAAFGERQKPALNRFCHEADMGVTRTWNRGLAASQQLIVSVLCIP